MACTICGSTETIRSHILPRALFRMGTTPGRQVIGNRRDGSGYANLQSGFWDDDILCAEHEAKLSIPDDYAARICRKFLKASADGSFSATIPNPHPDRLVSFAAACVWRMAVSRTHNKPEQMLGPYAARLRAKLFDGEPFDPLLLISRSAYVTGREQLRLGVLPHLYHELGLRFWRFVTCDLMFDLKLDNRPAPPPMAILGVNDSKEICLHEDFPQEVCRIPDIAESLVQLSLPRKR